MTRHLLLVVFVVSALTIARGADQTPPSPARYYNPRFSADASRVIFESTREGRMAIYTINTDGTGLRKVTNGRQDDAQPQWSADGRFITFTSNPTARDLNKVYVMGADGRDRRQISTGPKNDAAPSFSGDGRLVAWAATTELAENWRDIGVAAADSSGAQTLITSGPGNDQAPVWISSSRLVFVREFPPKTDWLAMSPEDHATRRASSEIMAVNADGSGLESLTKNDVYDGNPSWASTIERIFFSSARSGAVELFSMRADGSDVRRVSDAPGSVSSNARLVTYAKIVGGRSGIFVRDLSGGAERELVGGEKPRDINHYGIKWSPDGRFLAFESNMELTTPGYAIFVVGADGTSLRNLTPTAVEDAQPAWSPDGREIAFSSKRAGHLDIYLMNADGSNQRRLTTTAGGGYYGSVFSPDGQWVAVQGRPDNALFAERIHVVRRDGTGFRELSPPTMSTMSPKWSPDGRWIAAAQQPGVKRLWDEMTPPDMQRARAEEQVMLFRADGSETRPLTKDASLPTCCLAWSPDGRSASFFSGAEPNQTVFTINLDGTGLRRADDQSRLSPESRGWARSPDGRFFAYAKKTGTVSGVYVRDAATGRERLVAGGS